MQQRKIIFEKQTDYIIEFAKYEDIDNIMRFIKENWLDTHILANNRDFFEYQYVWGNEVCFVLSKDKESGQIECILGYIPYGENQDGLRDIYLALWKGKSGKNLFQGMGLLSFLEEKGRCRNLYCAGINPKTFSIYKYIGKQIEKMNHYYILNEKDDYKVAHVMNKVSTLYVDKTYDVQLVKDSQALKMDVVNHPEFEGSYKTREYIDKRYFHHPKYKYLVYEVCVDGEIVYVVGREQECNDEKIFRIVELWGKERDLSKVGRFLQDLLVKNDYEYLDCYAYGLSDTCMLNMGFAKVEEQDENIIPNYFEPYVRENVIIHIFVPKGEATRMFKGDGDQDRPNII